MIKFLYWIKKLNIETKDLNPRSKLRIWNYELMWAVRSLREVVDFQTGGRRPSVSAKGGPAFGWGYPP